MNNVIDIIITDDGRVIVQTSSIASKDHLSAERMLAELPDLLGAVSVSRSRLAQHQAQHQHHHKHNHNH